MQDAMTVRSRDPAFFAEDGYPTVEEAALADYPKTARPYVVSADIKGDAARVVVDTVPSYRWEVRLRRQNGLWFVEGASAMQSY